MLEVVTSLSLWDLIKHAGRWLANLKRARAARKQESREALQKVILAARKTAVYMRKLRQTGKHDYDMENELCTLWTELGFALDNLQMDVLAKRCSAIGQYWADPEVLDPVFLAKAGVGLLKMEKTAAAILAELKKQ